MALATAGAAHITVAGSAHEMLTIERRGRGVALRNGPEQAPEQAEIVLSPAAVEKLRFVHEVVEASGEAAASERPR